MFILSQGFFSVICSTSEELHRRLTQIIVRTGGPRLAKGIFHTTEHHTQYMAMALGWKRLIAVQIWAGSVSGGQLCCVSLVSVRVSCSLSVFYNYSLTNYNILTYHY